MWPVVAATLRQLVDFCICTPTKHLLECLPSRQNTKEEKRHMMTPGQRFKAAVAAEKPLQVVGAINAYAARLADHSGYKALYLSGGGVAAGSPAASGARASRFRRISALVVGLAGMADPEGNLTGSAVAVERVPVRGSSR